MTKPDITTTRKVLPFGELSPLEFERSLRFNDGENET